MASVKDMMFHLTELRRENEDLKEQIDHHLAQQRWFMQQIDGLQQEYGACYYHYSCSSLEMYELKKELFILKQKQGHAEHCDSKEEKKDVDYQGMFQADLESHARERFESRQLTQEREAMLLAEVESAAYQKHQERQSEQQKELCRLKKADSLLNHHKALVGVLKQKNDELELELRTFKLNSGQEKQQVATVRKKLKECQEDVEQKVSHIKNQKETIHRLQNNNIVITEKLAVTEGMLREAKREVGVATDLFNELSAKCGQIKADHNKTVRDLNTTIHSLRATNSKMVHKAVEQAKVIQKMQRSVNVTFQVDKETTEEVMREGYSDLQKFVEQKALQMEHTLALVAYALTHLKFVIEKFAFERCNNAETARENAAPSVSGVPVEFLHQVINQITRIFLIVPVPVMARNVDRLTELAAKQCISMKALHMIQYILPQTVEEAQESRQRAVFNSLPELQEFFTTDKCAALETVCVSVNAFMTLIGISK
jgi:hypothetical protein